MAQLPPCCTVCLGALQVLGSGDAEEKNGAVELASTVSTLRSEEGYWESGAAPAITVRVAPCASLQAAAAAIAAEYELGPFAVEVSLPASTAVRAQALAWRLAGSNAAAEGAAKEGPVSLKEAVRLVAGALLEQALGQPQDQQSDLRIVLTWKHASTTDEAAWLLRRGQSGGKGRHGRGPASSGEEPELLASQALVSRLDLMPRSEFEAGCPLAAAALSPPAAGTVLRVQAARRVLHVGGRYLKLRRGIPQSPWLIDGQRKGESSVQEALARTVLPHFRVSRRTWLVVQGCQVWWCQGWYCHPVAGTARSVSQMPESPALPFRLTAIPSWQLDGRILMCACWARAGPSCSRFSTHGGARCRRAIAPPWRRHLRPVNAACRCVACGPSL